MRTLVPPCRGWKRLTAAVCAGLMAGAVSFLPVVEGHPVLDSKGTAVSISGTANMNITSTAANNVIKWVDFSIGKNEKVAFDAHNYLNYVTGSARSDIYGTLTGGGKIALVNPNGILIGDGAVINVGSLYLSSKEMNANGFAAFESDGSLVLNGNAKGDVINMGKLNADVITVEGNNITFKNVADVTKGGSLSGSTISGSTVHNNGAVTLTANSGGEIHIGSDTGAESGYTTNGTTYNYKLVSTAAELQAINNDLDGKYMLKNDITSGLESFTPIGKGYGNAFAGRFDGLNYKIENLHINVNTSDRIAGLFGVNKGTIENLEVAGAIVTNSTGYLLNQIGAVAGVNYKNATIRNVRNTGAIDYSAVDNGVDFFGGIVGENEGTIERAYNTCNLTGNSDKNGNYTRIGGIAGKNDGVIKYAFNTGTITDSGTGTNWSSLGGIAGSMGQNYIGTIENAYNSGQITTSKTSDTYLGGIAGDLGNGTIRHTYNSGTLSLPEGFSADAGGIVGYRLSGGDVQDSYSTATGQGSNHVDGTPLTDENKKKKETYSGFDFSEGGAWRIYGEQTVPLLTVFLKRADQSKGTAVYNGTATGDVGANYSNSTYSGTVNQIGGINYVKDYTIVTPKELTVTGGVDKTYDGTTDATLTAANLEGVVTGDALTVDVTSAAYDNKNVGTGKTVTYGGLTISGAKAKNYTIGASGTTTGTITAKVITATFADISKTYDGTTSATAGTGTLSGVISGDTVTVTGSAAFEDKNVGTDKTVNYTSVALSGEEAGNYTIASTATGKGAIAAKSITATFADISKTYDGTTNATAGAGTLVGVETVDSGKVSVTANAAYADKNAGEGKTVNYTGVALSGDEAGNYTIADTTTGLGAISKANLKISVEDYSRAYNGTTDASGANFTAIDNTTLFEGDTVSGTRTFDSKDVKSEGKHTIILSDVTINDGNNGGNYDLTVVNNTNSSITRKALSLVADPVTITQGQESPATFTGKLTDFVENEGMAAGDSLAFATVDPVPTSVGEYAITGTLNGNASGDYGANYTFSNADSNATAFTIKAKPAPVPVNPGGTDTPVPDNGTLTEKEKAEAGNPSVATVTELENAAEVAKEQPFAKDMAAVAEMGAVEANTPSPASSDSGHTYTLLPGGLVAVRDDVNSATASAVMGGNGNEVVAAAEQADLAIGTEEVYNRQDNNASGENSDEEDKKQSE